MESRHTCLYRLKLSYFWLINGLASVTTHVFAHPVTHAHTHQGMTPTTPWFKPSLPTDSESSGRVGGPEGSEPHLLLPLRPWGKADIRDFLRTPGGEPLKHFRVEWSAQGFGAAQFHEYFPSTCQGQGLPSWLSW